MPFIIPAVAFGAGATLIAWGAKMLLGKDDSADAFVKEALSKIPDKIRSKIDAVELAPGGVKIVFKADVSAAKQKELQSELKKNIKIKPSADKKKQTATPVKVVKSDKKTNDETVKKENAAKKSPVKKTKTPEKPVEKSEKKRI